MLRWRFLCHISKALFFIKIALKLSYLFVKKCKILEGWGLHPQTPVPPAAGGFAPRPPVSGSWGLASRPPNTAPHCKFLATRLLLSTAKILSTSKRILIPSKVAQWLLYNKCIFSIASPLNFFPRLASFLTYLQISLALINSSGCNLRKF